MILTVHWRRSDTRKVDEERASAAQLSSSTSYVIVLIASDGRDALWSLGSLCTDQSTTRASVSWTSMAASAKRRLTFFFDFISPFSYFAHARLQLPSSHPRAFFSEGLERMEVEYRPVLLAGILKHWGQLGPAEIASKRRFTYEHSYWLGRRQEGMADFVFPSAHPFNSLPLLRTAVAARNDPQAITRIFRFVWAEGHIPDASPQFRALLQELGLQTSDISSVHVKEALRRNTEEAIGSGVFGVPSLLVSGDGQAPRVFWGNDSLGFAREWLMRQEEEGGGFFGEPSFTRLADLPLAATRVPIKGATATGGQQ